MAIPANQGTQMSDFQYLLPPKVVCSWLPTLQARGRGSVGLYNPFTSSVYRGLSRWLSSGDGAMGDDDRRLNGERRSGKDRRSGADTRSDEEKRLVGERRLNWNRRSGLDRRPNTAKGVLSKAAD
jgi:hypothetical protein